MKHSEKPLPVKKIVLWTTVAIIIALVFFVILQWDTFSDAFMSGWNSR